MRPAHFGGCDPESFTARSVRAPVNKYFENGSFNSTETMFCRLNRKVLVDAIVSKLGQRPGSIRSGRARVRGGGVEASKTARFGGGVGVLRAGAGGDG